MNPAFRTIPTSYFLLPIFQLLFIGPIFSQEPDLNYWEVNQLKVESITQWTILYYDNGEERSRFINKQWFYNEDGDLEETRASFTPDGSDWATTTYYYKDHRLVKEKVDDPLADGVIGTPARQRWLISKCENYNEHGRPVSAVLTYHDGLIQTWLYTYLEADRYERLLGTKKVFVDGRLKMAFMNEYGYRDE